MRQFRAVKIYGFDDQVSRLKATSKYPSFFKDIFQCIHCPLNQEEITRNELVLNHSYLLMGFPKKGEGDLKPSVSFAVEDQSSQARHSAPA